MLVSFSIGEQDLLLHSWLVDVLTHLQRPAPRELFLAAFFTRNEDGSWIEKPAGTLTKLPDLGEFAKGVGEGFIGSSFLISKQMVDLWVELRDSNNGVELADRQCMKLVISGPMGVGKSYIGTYLFSMAYALGWETFYIADAGVISKKPSEREVATFFISTYLSQNTPSVEILHALNKMDPIDAYSFLLDRRFESHEIGRNVLLLIDEHGSLFMPGPCGRTAFDDFGRLLRAFAQLNSWTNPHSSETRVVFTGCAHAHFEREYLKNGMRHFLRYIQPLSLYELNLLVQLVPEFKDMLLDNFDEVARATGRVPRELVYLVRFLVRASSSIKFGGIDFPSVLTSFSFERSVQLLNGATKYAKTFSAFETERYRRALSATFLPSDLRHSAFEYGFYDLGLVYRVDDLGIKNYAISPAATRAMLKIYFSMPLPSDYLLALKNDQLSGEAFEELVFLQLIKHGESGVTLSTCDLLGAPSTPITLRFAHYMVLGPNQMTPGGHVQDWLIRGFFRYPRFDFILGYTFLQVSISSFTDHDKRDSARISKAFEKFPQFGGKNQVELYLDETIGPGHVAIIDPVTHQFIVNRNGVPVPEFKIVYITNHGKPHYPVKVKEYPGLLSVSIEELKVKLFGELLR